MAWLREYETKKGIRYLIGWRDAVGKTHFKQAGPYLREAKDLRDEIEVGLVTGTSVDLKVTVNEVYKEFIRVYGETNKPSSTRITKAALRRFLELHGEHPIRSITSVMLQKYKNSQLGSIMENGKKRSSNGINFDIRNIGTFFNYAKDNGHLEDSPVSSISENGRRGRGFKEFEVVDVARFLTRGELCKLFVSAPVKKMRKIMFVLVYTGMRIGELINLKKEDIREHVVFVRGKTKSRSVPISNKVRRILRSIVGMINRNTFNSSWREAVSRANIGRIRPHDMRHTFASSYLQSGGTLADLQKILGHKSIKMLEIYAHFQQGYLKERVEKMRIPRAYVA